MGFKKIPHSTKTTLLKCPYRQYCPWLLFFLLRAPKKLDGNDCTSWHHRTSNEKNGKIIQVVTVSISSDECKLHGMNQWKLIPAKEESISGMTKKSIQPDDAKLFLRLPSMMPQ